MNKKRLYGIRGAWCTKNTEESLCHDVSHMISDILTKNTLDESDIVSVQFTVTADLDVLNPAAALRREGLCANTALFCALEPPVKGSLSHTVRVLLTAYLYNPPIHVYGGGAEVLRPNFANNEHTKG